MNRTLVLLLGLSIILSACQPDLSPARGGEPPPSPTLGDPLTGTGGTGRGTEPVEVVRATPIPTPTLHPAFVDLQTQIASSGERFTLQADGTIWDSQTGEAMPHLIVTPDGQVTIILKDGTVVIVTPEDMSVDEAGGLKIKGYQWDSEQGGWVAKATYTLEQLQAMNAQEKLAAAPEVEGYLPWKAAERFVLYETAEGARNLAYNLTTGEQVEIPQYKICKNERFYDCEIPQEDLINGKYWLWLNTLEVKFDPDKIKDVPIVVDERDYSSSWVDRTTVYHDSGWDKPPDFLDPSTAPFARDVTAGVTLYEEQGVKSFAAVRPVVFYDKATRQTHWVVAIQSYYSYHDGKDDNPRNPAYQRNLNNWLKNYKVTPLAVGCYTYAGERKCSYSLITGLPDPVLEASGALYPDMEARLLRFAQGEWEALAAPGLVVQTTSDMYPRDNKYR